MQQLQSECLNILVGYVKMKGNKMMLQFCTNYVTDRNTKTTETTCVQVNLMNYEKLKSDPIL